MQIRSMQLGLVGLFVAVSLVAGGCAKSDCAAGAPCTATGSSALRSITKAEALADFDEITASFKSLYGALERKEQRYGFRLNDLIAQYRGAIQRASTEAEYQGIFQEFVSRFEDAHISLTAPLVSDASHNVSLPFLVMPIENTWVIYHVSSSASALFQRGDELLSIDGVAATGLNLKFSKYVGIPNPLSAKHMVGLLMTRRPTYLAAKIKANQPASVVVRGADGTLRTVTTKWSERPHELPPTSSAPSAGKTQPKNLMLLATNAADITKAELTSFGATIPFFMTPQATAKLNMTPVTPSAAELTKFNLTADSAQAVGYFAGTYALNGKKVLFIRLPSYVASNTDDALNYLRALIDEQQPQVDALVFDQTHNPGGSGFFAVGVASLLAPKTFNSFVEALHGDRQWIATYTGYADQVRAQTGQDPSANATADALIAAAAQIDTAYSANKPLTAPMSVFLSPLQQDPDATHWGKPLLLLSDELSVSCGDIVPLLVKANKMGTLFGARTMGGGGNVEQVATLTNTQAVLELSRGMNTVYDPTGAYPDANYIEDNGIIPDVPYNHTLADFRAGYVGYVDAFNTALTKLF